MITGSVNTNIEALIELVVVGPTGDQRTVAGVIDTGFSGDLTLPSDIIDALGLTWLGRELGILADGSTDLFDVYSAVVLWDGRSRPVEVEAANTQPLIGMNVLRGHLLRIEVVNGGRVEIGTLA